MGPLDASACAWNEPGNQAARQKRAQNKDQGNRKKWGKNEQKL
jgi:hypothetical protein